MIAEIDLDKETVFVLEMEIEGDSTNDKPEMRFCIELEKYTLSLKAKQLSDGMYEITCPRLKGIVESGSYTANVEVYIGDKRFVPLTETVKIKHDIKPVVKITESKASAPVISVKPATEIKSKITKTDNIITR